MKLYINTTALNNSYTALTELERVTWKNTHIQEKFENSNAGSKENPLHYLHRF